jgi:hypothetical protein
MLSCRLKENDYAMKAEALEFKNANPADGFLRAMLSERGIPDALWHRGPWG